jgi:hypothetical protein
MTFCCFEEENRSSVHTPFQAELRKVLCFVSLVPSHQSQRIIQTLVVLNGPALNVKAAHIHIHSPHEHFSSISHPIILAP